MIAISLSPLPPFLPSLGEGVGVGWGGGEAVFLFNQNFLAVDDVDALLSLAQTLTSEVEDQCIVVRHLNIIDSRFDIAEVEGEALNGVLTRRSEIGFACRNNNTAANEVETDLAIIVASLTYAKGEDGGFVASDCAIGGLEEVAGAVSRG